LNICQYAHLFFGKITYEKEYKKMRRKKTFQENLKNVYFFETVAYLDISARLVHTKKSFGLAKIT
jgi:translation initiation factor IF-3